MESILLLYVDTQANTHQYLVTAYFIWSNRNWVCVCVCLSHGRCAAFFFCFVGVFLLLLVFWDRLHFTVVVCVCVNFFHFMCEFHLCVCMYKLWPMMKFMCARLITRMGQFSVVYFRYSVVCIMHHTNANFNFTNTFWNIQSNTAICLDQYTNTKQYNARIYWKN